MEITCEVCDGTNWKMTIHEFKRKSMGAKLLWIYSALKCDSCGMVYPITPIDRQFWVSLAGHPFNKEKFLSALQEKEE